MADFLAVTACPFDNSLLGHSEGIVLRLLTQEEQVAIEDRFFRENELRVSLPEGSTAISVPDKELKGTDLNEFRTAVEFCLAVLSQRGFQNVRVTATFGERSCYAISSLDQAAISAPVYKPELTGAAICQWISVVLAARQKVKDRMHVTADRFVRYSRNGNTPDSLLDLCICLESLIGADSEISFRFAVCLAKVCGGGKAHEIGELLDVLYTLRSKVVHGSDSTKAYSKLAPNLSTLQNASKIILTKYVLHLAEKNQEHWKKHLKLALLT